jgi:hypothetical protein
VCGSHNDTPYRVVYNINVLHFTARTQSSKSTQCRYSTVQCDAVAYVPLMRPTSTSFGHQPAVSTTLAALMFLGSVICVCCVCYMLCVTCYILYVMCYVMWYLYVDVHIYIFVYSMSNILNVVNVIYMYGLLIVCNVYVCSKNIDCMCVYTYVCMCMYLCLYRYIYVCLLVIVLIWIMCVYVYTCTYVSVCLMCVCLLVVVWCAWCAEVEVVERTRDGCRYADPVTPRHLPVK